MVPKLFKEKNFTPVILLSALFFILGLLFLTTNIFAASVSGLLPTADGTNDSTQWQDSAKTACDSTDCYTEVNEPGACDGDTSYIEASADGAVQTFDIEEADIPDDSTITALDVTICQKQKAPNTNNQNNLQARYCIHGSCFNSGTDITTTDDYTEATQRFSDLSITKTSESNLEIGAAITGTSGKEARVSRISADITYTAPDKSGTTPPDTTPPKNPSVIINNDAEVTSNREVVATVSADGAEWVEISQDPDFLDAAQVRYNDTKAEGYDFKLSLPDGEKTVYARFMDAAGNFSEVVSDTILLRTITPKLGVDISADPSTGEGSIEGVNLTANVFGTALGSINYTFYCNRSDTDTTITEPWDVKFDRVNEETLTAQDACNYGSPGTYVVKVIVEREGLSAEARTSLAVKSPPEPTPEPEPEPELREPEDIERKSETAEELPPAPGITVPSFSDQFRWYRKVQDVIVFWEVTGDTEAVSAVIDKSPTTEPTSAEPQLTTGENFGPVDDGVWYVHVRFQNSVGWGLTTHHKVQIDRTPPAVSAITLDKQVSQDPTRHVQYQGSDALSGIAEVRVTVDGGEPLADATFTSATLPPQSLGEHSVQVAFVDIAGNTREVDKIFTVLPLTSPEIGFITTNIFEGDKIFAFGKSLPNGFVEVSLWPASAGNNLLAKKITTASFSGNWAVAFDNPYPEGSYAITANARDSRGAISKAVELPRINIREKPAFTLGPISLGWLEFVLITALIIAFAGSTSIGYWLYRKKIKLAYKDIVGLDLEKYTFMIDEGVDKLEKAQKLKGESSAVEKKAALDKVKNLTNRMRKYLSGEIKKL